MSRRIATACVLIILLSIPACRRTAAPAPAAGGEAWPVTAWGTTFEAFAEIEPLIAGVAAKSNTHVTVLQDFSPLRQGSVKLLLRDGGGEPLVFEQKQPKRDGIFLVDVIPPREGVFSLAFAIESPGGREEIPAGRVRVGSKTSPGQIVDVPGEARAGSAVEAETQSVGFLKEQQWRTEFATARVSEGALRDSVAGSARVRAAAGGEAALTSAVEAVVAPHPWPFAGQQVARGATVFALIARVAGEQSLPQLRAEVASIEAERDAARNRAERLDQLLKVEAVSRAEVEKARASLIGLEARREAARRDLETASAARTGGGGTPSLFVRAPWAGRVAEVAASPGQSVAPGAILGRVVKERPLWLEIALRPEDAMRLTGAKASGLLLRRAESAEPLEIPATDVRLVSRSPEVDPKTSSVAVLLEINRSVSDLPIGTTVEAEPLLSGERRGTLIPVSALVQESGVTIVYEQLAGESFARHEVRVLQRQGREALVQGLRAGSRIVTVGGAAIRRASLLSTGAPEGHVH